MTHVILPNGFTLLKISQFPLKVGRTYIKPLYFTATFPPFFPAVNSGNDAYWNEWNVRIRDKPGDVTRTVTGIFPVWRRWRGVLRYCARSYRGYFSFSSPLGKESCKINYWCTHPNSKSSVWKQTSRWDSREEMKSNFVNIKG